MTQTFGNQGWNVGRSGTLCAGCAKELQPGQICYAALCEGPAMAEGGKTAAANEGNNGANSGGGGGNGMSLLRVDFCEVCWQAGRRPVAEVVKEGEGNANRQGGEMFSFWKTLIPTPSEKKRLFVDDAVLVDLFQRLETKDAPQDMRFRFVLALILMRKRILRYESSRPLEQAGTEEWDMTLRGSEKENRLPAPVKVINPNLTPEQISEVSVQLSQILAEEV